jgi:hypothetical protein
MLTTQLGPVVEHASTDDCAIIVAIGRAKLHWDATTPPTQDFFPSWDGEKGSTYVQDCAWRKYGVAPPKLGSKSSTAGFFVSRPHYAPGKITATVHFNISLKAKGRPPFISEERCTVRRQAMRWIFAGCHQTLIT